MSIHDFFRPQCRHQPISDKISDKIPDKISAKILRKTGWGVPMTKTGEALIYFEALNYFEDRCRKEPTYSDRAALPS